MKNLLSCILAVFVLSSCCNLGSDPLRSARELEREAVRTEFQKEKAAWEALGIDRYCFTLDSDAGAPSGFYVTVSVYPDKESELTDRWGKKIESTNNDLLQFLYSVAGVTVSHIYTWMEKVLNHPAVDIDGYGDVIGTGVELEYDKTYHYPVYFIGYPVQTGEYSIVGGSAFCRITEFEDLRQQ